MNRAEEMKEMKEKSLRFFSASLEIARKEFPDDVKLLEELKPLIAEQFDFISKIEEKLRSLPASAAKHLLDKALTILLYTAYNMCKNPEEIKDLAKAILMNALLNTAKGFSQEEVRKEDLN